MLATYHNHTDWSDGTGSIDDMIAGARTLGVQELGLSDHFTLHPTQHDIAWAMEPDRVGAYVDAVRDAAARAAAEGGPVVRAGLEADWFEPTAGALRAVLSSLPLDFVVGSVHYHGDTELDGRPSVWEAWSPRQQDAVHRAYWVNMQRMAESGLFDIVGHLDLTKKFNFHPSEPIDDQIDRTLDAIANSGMVVELNTNGWNCPCAEAYPSRALLARCRARDIPVTISADAHHPDHLVRDFGRAVELLQDVGYAQVARFAQREAHFEPITAAMPASG